jgi:hypothetical protein
MLRLLPLSLLALVLTVASHAQAQQVDRIEIVEWGIFQHDRHAEIPAPESPTGTRDVLSNIRLQQVTTIIPALVGMKFGIRYRVVGSPRGAIVSLKHVNRYPRQGLTNPAKGKTFSMSEYYSDAIVGEDRYRGYTLEFDWEVEPGPWTMEVWHEGRRLVEKTFMVTRLVSSAE